MIAVIVTQSLLWAIASVLLLVAPGWILGRFDMACSPATESLARLFGGELTGLTLASWFTRHLVYTPKRKHLALAYAASNTLGFFVTASAMTGGSMARFTWALCGLYLVYAVAFCYFRFFDRRRYEQRIDGALGIFR